MVKKIIFSMLVAITMHVQARDITAEPNATTGTEYTMPSTKAIINRSSEDVQINGVYISKTTKKVLIDNVWMEEKDKLDNLQVISISKTRVKLKINQNVIIIKLNSL